MQPKRVGIFGSSGTGKTTKAKALVQNLNRLVIVDPKREWLRDGKKWRKNATFCDNYSDFCKLYIKQFSKNFTIIFTPNPLLNEVDETHRICNFIYSNQKGYKTKHNAQVTIFVDECQLVCPSGTKRKNPSNSLIRMAEMGRDLGINMIIVSQRIKAVDIALRANFNYCYLFRLSELADIKEAINLVFDKDKVLNMPNYDYFIKDFEGGKIQYVVNQQKKIRKTRKKLDV